MPGGLGKEPNPWNFSNGGVTRLEEQPCKGRVCQWASPQITVMHTRVLKHWCTLSLLPASPLKQSRGVVCNDWTFKALGNRRQNTETSGAIPPDSSRPVGTRSQRKGRTPGRSDGTTGLGRQCRSPVGRTPWSNHILLGRARDTCRHTGGRAGINSTNPRQSRAKQPEASTAVRSPPGEVSASIGLWWCHDLTRRDKRADAKLRTVKKQVSSENEKNVTKLPSPCYASHLCCQGICAVQKPQYGVEPAQARPLDGGGSVPCGRVPLCKVCAHA